MKSNWHGRVIIAAVTLAAGDTTVHFPYGRSRWAPMQRIQVCPRRRLEITICANGSRRPAAATKFTKER